MAIWIAAANTIANTTEYRANMPEVDNVVATDSGDGKVSTLDMIIYMKGISSVAKNQRNGRAN